MSSVSDQQMDRASYWSVFDDWSGVRVYVGQPAEFPLVREASNKVQPGKVREKYHEKGKTIF